MYVYKQDQCGMVFAHVCMCIRKTNVKVFVHVCMCIRKTNVEFFIHVLAKPMRNCFCTCLCKTNVELF